MAKTITEATDHNGGSKAIALDGLRSQPERLRSFLTDVRAEMRKVIWPSREEVKSTTSIVVATVFIFAGFFFVVDYVVGQGITRLIQHFTAQ